MDKLSFYTAIHALICAILEDGKGAQKGMKELWSNLFPELAKDDEDKARKAEEVMKGLPPVLYVRPKNIRQEEQEITEVTRPPDGWVKLEPGVKFGEKKLK